MNARKTFANHIPPAASLGVYSPNIPEYGLLLHCITSRTPVVSVGILSYNASLPEQANYTLKGTGT